MVKKNNKDRLAAFFKANIDIDVNPESFFDIQVKRIHKHKRQLSNCLGTIHQYLSIKGMTAEQKKNVVPRVTIIGGKAASGYDIAKRIIELFNSIAEVVNVDPDVGDNWC
eukprot:TRINITY_DN3250_c4_g2_i1.p1 TRINITY_DN3250_c4_g2~~TRINITY_DN3250_c4_g2_i1.p1  ORF type:complete len:110 (+),score=27.40 TRINITY_DN3250_c4_g2_i1:1759-2088(+)